MTKLQSYSSGRIVHVSRKEAQRLLANRTHFVFPKPLHTEVYRGRSGVAIKTKMKPREKGKRS